MPRVWILVGCFCVSTVVLFADTPNPSLESMHVQRAQQEVDRVARLVEQGGLAKASLDKAEAALVDARDAAVLAQTLYGSVTVDDLNEELSSNMVASATRRLDRQKEQVEQTRKLVDAGVAPRTSLTPLLEELDSRRKTLDLAMSRADMWRHLTEMARAEQALHDAQSDAPPAIAGAGVMPVGQTLKNIEAAYENQFGKPLPISANGETRLHRSLGFDHRGRVDVALNPDQSEGQWLRRLLEDSGIPYLAFRGFVPGKATGAHIHIGPPSSRLTSAD
jgi:hypothetical protein